MVIIVVILITIIMMIIMIIIITIIIYIYIYIYIYICASLLTSSRLSTIISSNHSYGDFVTFPPTTMSTQVWASFCCVDFEHIIGNAYF